MEASGEPSHDLMDDIRAVDWLPLDAAVERLSRAYERAFLANVGPLALESAALARRPRVKKQAVPEKRRRQPAVAPQPAMPEPIASRDATPSIGAAEPRIAGSDVVAQDAAAETVESQSDNEIALEAVRGRRVNLVQKVRNWLRRAA
jgi:8-oxo-dGTP diphosphatase